LVEYQNYRTTVPKELGRCVSAVTDTRLVADRYCRGNESIIAFQEVKMSDFFAVHMKTLNLVSWSQRVTEELLERKVAVSV
jgi:hypothetical protein